MKFLSLHVMTCMLLSACVASEATLPSTRGGATAVSKYSSDEQIAEEEVHTVSSRIKSTSPLPSVTKRILKKRSKKSLKNKTVVKESKKHTTEVAVVPVELAVEPFVEPMCRPDEGRFALFPIRNHRMWEMYKKHVASFWTVRHRIRYTVHECNQNEFYFYMLIMPYSSPSPF